MMKVLISMLAMLLSFNYSFGADFQCYDYESNLMTGKQGENGKSVEYPEIKIKLYGYLIPVVPLNESVDDATLRIIKENETGRMCLKGTLVDLDWTDPDALRFFYAYSIKE